VLLVAALLFGGAAAPARATEEDDLTRTLRKIAAARASLKTLRAPFKQRRVIGLLATVVESTGTLTLVRAPPGAAPPQGARLRWELAPPDAIVYWVGPEGLALATREGVTRLPARQAGRFGLVLADLLVLVGGDLGTLRARYALEAAVEAERLLLSARPRAPELAKHVSRLRLRLGKEPWQLERIEIHEPNGDHSVIDFGVGQRDAEIDPAIMKPPP
jgi:hypothetical protein